MHETQRLVHGRLADRWKHQCATRLCCWTPDYGVKHNLGQIGFRASLQTLTGGGVFDESIKEEAFRKWSTLCFYFFLFSTFTICISTDLFFVSSHFVFLVLITVCFWCPSFTPAHLLFNLSWICTDKWCSIGKKNKCLFFILWTVATEKSKVHALKLIWHK